MTDYDSFIDDDNGRLFVMEGEYIGVAIDEIDNVDDLQEMLREHPHMRDVAREDIYRSKLLPLTQVAGQAS